MRHIIHNLRQKPDYHKRGVAFAVSGAFTLLLVAIWGITLPVRYADLFGNQTDDQTAAALSGSPIDTLTASLNNPSSNQSTSNGVTVSNTTTFNDLVQGSSPNEEVTSQPNTVIISDTDASSSSQPQSSSSVSPFTPE